jgi:hypothetical protein
MTQVRLLAVLDAPLQHGSCVKGGELGDLASQFMGGTSTNGPHGIPSQWYTPHSPFTQPSQDPHLGSLPFAFMGEVFQPMPAVEPERPNSTSGNRDDPDKHAAVTCKDMFPPF